VVRTQERERRFLGTSSIRFKTLLLTFRDYNSSMIKVGDLVRCKVVRSSEDLAYVLDVPKEDGSWVYLVWLKTGSKTSTHTSLVEMINAS